MVLDTAKPKYKERTIWPGMRVRDAARKLPLKVYIYRYSRSIPQRSSLSWISTRNRMVRTKVQRVGWTYEWRPNMKTHSRGKAKIHTKDNSILLWKKQARTGLWSFDLITEPLSWWKIAYDHESGEPIEEPIHPGQQRRIQQGQEVFSEDYFTSARVDQHTGWQYWPSSPSSSWWYASEWSWKWAHNFFIFSNLSFFCYSWFRLQLIAIHCNRQHPHTAYFLMHFHTCAYTTLWLKVSLDVSAWKSAHPNVITCLIVCCFSLFWPSSLSCVSTFRPFSLCERHIETTLIWSKSLARYILRLCIVCGWIWKGDVVVTDIEELEEMDASELHARRVNASEVLKPMQGDNFIFPVADGTVKISGGDQRLRTSTFIRERPKWWEKTRSFSRRIRRVLFPKPSSRWLNTGWCGR